MTEIPVFLGNLQPLMRSFLGYRCIRGLKKHTLLCIAWKSGYFITKSRKISMTPSRAIYDPSMRTHDPSTTHIRNCTGRKTSGNGGEYGAETRIVVELLCIKFRRETMTRGKTIRGRYIGVLVMLVAMLLMTACSGVAYTREGAVTLRDGENSSHPVQIAEIHKAKKSTTVYIRGTSGFSVCDYKMGKHG